MKRIAYAKINRSLRIVGQREDGYHLLESEMIPISLGDILYFKESEEGFKLTSNDPTMVSEDNYIVQAHRLMEEISKSALSVHIHLDKKIPIGSGLAGGTTDGAQTMLGLRELFSIDISLEELQERALKLGADFPYCLSSKRSLVTGIGENVKELPKLETIFLLLVNPGFSLSTPEVYRYYDESPVTGKYNDLEPGVVNRSPVIGSIINKLESSGAKRVSMSGSGPTVFGEFASKEERDQVKKVLESKDLKVYSCESL